MVRSAVPDGATTAGTDLPASREATRRPRTHVHEAAKNFLFVGTDEAGENLAGLYSLIASCEANGVNPVDHLADVAMRVQTHPALRIDELLPHLRKPAVPPAPS